MRYETNLEDVKNKKTLKLFSNQPWIPFLSIADSGGNKPSIFHDLWVKYKEWKPIVLINKLCLSLLMRFEVGQRIRQLFGWIIQTQTLKDLPRPPCNSRVDKSSTFRLFTTILLGKEQNRIRKDVQENNKITDKTRRKNKLKKKRATRAVWAPWWAVASWIMVAVACDVIYSLLKSLCVGGGDWLAGAPQSSFSHNSPSSSSPPSSTSTSTSSFFPLFHKGKFKSNLVWINLDQLKPSQGGWHSAQIVEIAAFFLACNPSTLN